MLKRIGTYFLPALLLAFSLPNYTHAQNEQKPLYGVLLDNSGSLERQLPQVLALGEGIIKRINQRGPTALFTFRPNPTDKAKTVISSGIGWSQDEKDLSAYLRTISVERTGSMTILDAISVIAGELDSKAEAGKGNFGEKIIILVSDGDYAIRLDKRKMYLPTIQEQEDERRKRESRLVKALKESGVKVYAVGLVRELNAEGGFTHKSRRESAENLLRKITKETGGRVVVPKSKTWDVDTVLDELLAH